MLWVICNYMLQNKRNQCFREREQQRWITTLSYISTYSLILLPCNLYCNWYNCLKIALTERNYYIWIKWNRVRILALMGRNGENCWPNTTSPEWVLRALNVLTEPIHGPSLVSSITPVVVISHYKLVFQERVQGLYICRKHSSTQLCLQLALCLPPCHQASLAAQVALESAPSLTGLTLAVLFPAALGGWAGVPLE